MRRSLANEIAFEAGQRVPVVEPVVERYAHNGTPVEARQIAADTAGALLRWLLGDDPSNDQAILRRARLLAYHSRIEMGGIVTHSDLAALMKLSRRRVSQLLREFSRETEEFH
jgi:hypothetical protein